MLRRVVITGLGMISPLGISVSQSWKSLINGKSGIINLKDLDQYKNNNDFPDCCIAPIHNSFDLKKWRVPFTSSLTNSLIMAASEEAILDSSKKNNEKSIKKDLNFSTEKEKERSGVILGSMNSNIARLTEFISGASQKGYNTLNRLTMLNVLTNMGTANVSIKYGLKGPSSTISNACSTGASAIGEAYRNIQLGEADIMIAGGADEVVNPVCIYASLKMQAMSNKKYENPKEASRPFDKDRSGFILGEGAGILILEDLNHALKRNAKIYAEIKGYSCTSDGYHLTKPKEDGDGGYRAMIKVLEQAEISPSHLDHINCHSTSTPVGDEAEAKAIIKLLESDEIKSKVSITACKGAIGHCFAGAGAIESIFGIMSIIDGISPGILNLKNPPDCGFLNYTFEECGKKQNINYVLKNSFGFGGVNVALLFRKYI